MPMVFTLHRYIFRDLLKTFCLATLVLSVVLSLGVMLRPLRQFNVAPAQVPELLLCTLPITLTIPMTTTTIQKIRSPDAANIGTNSQVMSCPCVRPPTGSLTTRSAPDTGPHDYILPDGSTKNTGLSCPAGCSGVNPTR